MRSVRVIRTGDVSLMFHRPDGRKGLATTIFTLTFEQAKQIAEWHWETGIWAPLVKQSTAWVLHIEFADDRPHVAAFNTFDEAAAQLDAFKASEFGPSQDARLLRARIFLRQQWLGYRDRH